MNTTTDILFFSETDRFLTMWGKLGKMTSVGRGAISSFTAYDTILQSFESKLIPFDAIIQEANVAHGTAIHFEPKISDAV